MSIPQLGAGEDVPGGRRGGRGGDEQVWTSSTFSDLDFDFDDLLGGMFRGELSAGVGDGSTALTRRRS